MDPVLLRRFLWEVIYCCEGVTIAWNDYLEHWELRPIRPHRLWYDLQNLASSSTSLSRLLWGQSLATADARQELRAILAVADDSPIRQRDFRNKVEHIDELIDDWFKRGGRFNMADRNIGPVFRSFDPLDVFRHFDPSTGRLTILTFEYPLLGVLQEVSRILPLAQAAASRPLPNVPQAS
jgi:hypothetical protein